ncbi:helix-turn-helix domain-containing protein [Cryobacterium mannosilyticum]|uniref:XRE family transcriptional regulator n=1 Tax=Cryobacterium mannosilyticum TaxID=1259190 RepID=A0A4R8W9S9_9MICO|nr:helix-turn-helix domain-containing protein [Cryobacterium mannosilyticum]TFC03630.1 XRE family transcriptional regulator [Cryobacterium mannosilyticum]
MAKTFSYNPGAKIAKYRKHLKMSAEELAEKAGFGLTRSIVANLENGRKDDLTVRQLMAIALVLHVSPADLVFDVTKPYYEMVLTDGEGFEAKALAWLAREWFGGTSDVRSLNAHVDGSPLLEGGYPAFFDQLVAETLRHRSSLHVQLAKVERELAELRKTAQDEGRRPDEDAERDANEKIRALQAQLYTTDNALRSNGVDLDDVGAVF